MTSLFLAILMPLTTNAQAVENDSVERVGNISAKQEKRISTRTEVLGLWSFAFGPAAASKMNNNSLNYAFTLGRHWEVNENAEIRANLHTTLPSSGFANYTSFGIGGSWLFTTYDISPIAGAELGYGYASIPRGPDKSGFSVGAHAGLRLFRTAKAQMGIEGYAKTLLINGEKPADYGMMLSLLY